MESNPKSARLIVSAEGKKEVTVEILDRLTIGRSTTNQLILDDQKASRSHAEIRHSGRGRYRISDVGSANGTWINGRRLTVPRELEDGDEVLIGSVCLRFVASPAPVTQHQEATISSGTAHFMRSELIVVLVADIRNFTGMSETLPNREFSRLIADWFREASDIIEKNGGTIDKFIGDAVMAYWVASSKSNAAKEVDAGIGTARQLIARAAGFSEQMSAQFPGQVFQIGIGLNTGNAMLGNVGTGENQSFTVVGDSVNVAFGLEALTKEKGSPVIASRSLIDAASKNFQFRDLGQAEVKGRKEPVSICALDFGAGATS